jgi:5'-methylthioadenosine phosphorylase
MIIKTLMENVKKAQSIIREAVDALGKPAGCGCGESLKMAVITDRASIPEETKRRLAPIMGKYWGKA